MDRNRELLIRRIVGIVMLTAGLIGIVVVGWLWIPRPAVLTDEIRLTTRVRALSIAAFVYAEIHGRHPPPDRMSSLLIGAGMVTEDLFEIPDGAPAFFAVATPAGADGDRRREAPRPLYYVNPVLAKGRATAVAYDDERVELVEGSALRAFLREHADGAPPVR